MAEVGGLLSQLKNSKPEQQSRVAGALINLCTNAENRREILALGGIPILVGLLNSADTNVLKRACSALTNIAVDADCRAAIRNVEGIEKLLDVLDDPEVSKICKGAAAGAILNLAADVESRQIIRECGGIEILVARLKDGDLDTKGNAAGALGFMVLEPVNSKIMRDAGGLKAMIDLLDKNNNSDDEELLAKATGAIWNFCLQPDNIEPLIDVGAVEALVDILNKNESLEIISNAVVSIGLLAVNPAAATAIRQNDGIFPIINILNKNDCNNELVAHVAGALWNCAQDDTNRKLIAEMGAIEPLLSHLQPGSLDPQSLLVNERFRAVERVVGALMTLAIDLDISANLRELGAIDRIVPLLECQGHQIPENFNAMRNATIAMGIFAYVDENKAAIREAGGLEPLIAILSINNEVLLEKATAALMNLALDAINRVEIRKLDGIAPLIELLYSPWPQVQQNAAGALWNLAADDVNKMIIRELGGLKPLIALISNGKLDENDVPKGARVGPNGSTVRNVPGGVSGSGGSGASGEEEEEEEEAGDGSARGGSDAQVRNRGRVRNPGAYGDLAGQGADGDNASNPEDEALKEEARERRKRAVYRDPNKYGGADSSSANNGSAAAAAAASADQSGGAADSDPTGGFRPSRVTRHGNNNIVDANATKTGDGISDKGAGIGHIDVNKLKEYHDKNSNGDASSPGAPGIPGAPPAPGGALNRAGSSSSSNNNNNQAGSGLQKGSSFGANNVPSLAEQINNARGSLQKTDVKPGSNYSREPTFYDLLNDSRNQLRKKFLDQYLAREQERAAAAQNGGRANNKGGDEKTQQQQQQQQRTKWADMPPPPAKKYDPKTGLDEEGFDKHGYDAEGFDRNGYAKQGGSSDSYRNNAHAGMFGPSDGDRKNGVVTAAAGQRDPDRKGKPHVSRRRNADDYDPRFEQHMKEKERQAKALAGNANFATKNVPRVGARGGAKLDDGDYALSSKDGAAAAATVPSYVQNRAKQREQAIKAMEEAAAAAEQGKPIDVEKIGNGVLPVLDVLSDVKDAIDQEYDVNNYAKPAADRTFQPVLLRSTTGPTLYIKDHKWQGRGTYADPAKLDRDKATGGRHPTLPQHNYINARLAATTGPRVPTHFNTVENAKFPGYGVNYAMPANRQRLAHNRSRPWERPAEQPATTTTTTASTKAATGAAGRPAAGTTTRTTPSASWKTSRAANDNNGMPSEGTVKRLREKYGIQRDSDADLAMFNNMKGRQVSPFIQAKLSELISTVGTAKATTGRVIDDKRVDVTSLATAKGAAAPPPSQQQQQQQASPAARTGGLSNSNSSNNTAPAVTTTAKPTTQPGGIVLTLEQMANVKVAGIDNTKKETYLSDADFQKHFKMSRADFYKQPVWKQNDQKKKLGIF